MKNKFVRVLTAAIVLTAIAPLAAMACGDKENQTNTTSEPIRVETTSS